MKTRWVRQLIFLRPIKRIVIVGSSKWGAFYVDDLPPLSHEEQQQAVVKIQELMSQGTSTAEAIKIVAENIRAEYAAKQQQDEE